MNKMCIIIAALLLNILIGSNAAGLVGQQTNGNPATTADTFILDEQEFKNLVHQVKHLTDATENMGLRIELITIRIEKELAALKTSITQDIRELLNQHVSTNIRSEENILQAQMNSLWANMTGEIDDLKVSLATSMKSEDVDFTKSQSAIEPQIGTNISQSLQGLDKSENSLIETTETVANLTKKKGLPSSCAEALQNGEPSGIYTLLLPSTGLEPFNVYCLKDPENGPAWTVVERRQDDETNFFRNWQQYKDGFGDLNGEYFIGLDHLHALTNQATPRELWIKLTDWEKTTKHAKYSRFNVGDEASKYYLGDLGEYSGDAGDLMDRSNTFSTYDSDNDSSESNCAEILQNGWWFSDCRTGYLNSEHNDSYVEGTYWHFWHYSIKYAHMAIRPKNF